MSQSIIILNGEQGVTRGEYLIYHSRCCGPLRTPLMPNKSSPLVLVRKKSGGLQVCVDYRAMNNNTIPDHYLILRINELMDMVGRRKAKILSLLDLMKGYHQVRMEKDSKAKMAFMCNLGHYQYQ